MLEGRVTRTSGGRDLHLGPLLRCDVWNCRVFKDAAVEEFHDVEVATKDAFILTKGVSLRDWDVCLLQGVNDAVFPVDLVCRLLNVSGLYVPASTVLTLERSWPGGFFLITNFFPFLSVSWYVGFDCPYPNCPALVLCRVQGRPIYLLDVNRNGNFRNMIRDVALQRGYVNGLPHVSSHGVQLCEVDIPGP